MEARPQQSSVICGTSFSDLKPVSCSCDRDNWGYRRHPETSAKDIISDHTSFSPRAAIIPLLDWLPACAAHDLCIPKNPDALGHDSSFFCCDPTTVACLCSQNATVQACLHTHSGLETYALMTLSFSVLSNCLTCFVAHRSAACRCFIRFSPNAYECGQVRQYALGRALERTPGWHLRDTRTPFDSRNHLVLLTMLISEVGVNRTLLRRLLKGRAFALALLRPQIQPSPPAAFASVHALSKLYR